MKPSLEALDRAVQPTWRDWNHFERDYPLECDTKRFAAALAVELDRRLAMKRNGVIERAEAIKAKLTAYPDGAEANIVITILLLALGDIE